MVDVNEVVGARAARGTSLALVGQLVSQLLRFASSIVLARFLPETAFGVNAILSSVTLGLWMITDVGIPASIVRSGRNDDAFVHTAWTLSLVRGAVLLGLGLVLGPPLAALYGEPGLVWLLPLSSLMIFFVAAESTRIYSAQRDLQPGRVILLEVLAQAISLGVSIPVAIATGHVIAFVAGAVVSGFVKFLLSHLILGARMRIAWERESLREIFSFGRWVFLSTLFAYVAIRWDIFALGRLEGMALLGVYGVANQITSVPHQMTVHATGLVLTPVLADAWRHAGGDRGGDVSAFATRLREARRGYLPVALLLFLGAATTAPAFFVVAYKAGFHAAGVMAQALMIQAFLDFQQEASSRALVARGDGRGLALSNALRLIATIVSTYVGLSLFGFWGFVQGNVVGGLVGVVIVGLRLRAQGMVGALADDLKAFAVFLVLLGVGAGIPLLLEDALGWPAAWTTLAGCVVVCGPLGIVVLQQFLAVRRRHAEPTT
jgi:O-antigen/teichoic acid export membrane protein